MASVCPAETINTGNRSVTRSTKLSAIMVMLYKKVLSFVLLSVVVDDAV